MRPILMNAEMVRAILEGRKTQTRRLVKPQPSREDWNQITTEFYNPTKIDRKGMEYPGDLVFGFANETESWVSPFGKPGDRLWVREAWRVDASLDDRAPSTFAGWPVEYLADNAKLLHGAFYGTTDGKTRPSIHMPRWASRITLEVTRVWVERVQDIREEDAEAEGVTLPVAGGGDCPHIVSFNSLWWDIYNEYSQFCWDANPWVWACEFKVVEEA